MCPTATLRALEAQMAELVKANQAMLVTLQRAIAGGEALSVAQQLQRLELLVVSEWGIPMDALKATDKHAHIVEPRHVAMYLAAEALQLPHARVGHWLGGRDHGTVANALRRVRERMETSARFQERVQTLVGLLLEDAC